MPKRKKTKEEKERLIEKTNISQEEANSLEQRLEKDEEKVDFSELREFLEEPETRRGQTKNSPSLNKINAPQRNPVRLESDLTNAVTSTNAQNGNEEENGLNYIPKIGGSEEPRYVQYQGRIIENIVPRREIGTIGIDQPFNRREIAFESSPNARLGAQESLEKYSPVRKSDREKIGKEKPFEKREIKYTHEKY
jgi:hypothetical protein